MFVVRVHVGLHIKIMIKRTTILIVLVFVFIPFECTIQKFENKPEVDHIDRDGFNNNLENLRWVTSKENQNNKSNNKK